MTEFREALRLDKNMFEANYNLGNTLRQKGRTDEAIAAYQETIRPNEGYAEAQCNLGQLLLRKGQLHKAVAELHRGHEPGIRDPKWSYPSDRWLRHAHEMEQLDEQLPALLQGKRQPRDSAECLACATLCQQYK